ncbi:methyl-accepting chemotaxis protein [Roseobacter sinensis]|uniref:Methyl-accepting chemotaxis protein n=1 Tax=Roseobacter sinensis TaxID=2931391 RepID=A0ABT3BBM6_9RHOB|nr:methyl-accepting chemotaxis protein [Roseobacter sp. WL0113]MCV3270962.1 methyl-accepting chemotaxis protein [Roseobacter sp. WL0113]
MTVHPQLSDSIYTDRLTEAAAALGYEIVDISGFLDLVEEHARAQRKGLAVLGARADDMGRANSDVRDAVQTMAQNTGETAQDVKSSAALMRTTGEKTRTVAGWVQDLSQRTETVSDTLSAVKTNNQQIASIATQVNTLAINAKIEAARAGEAGRGFAVVAEAINDLSQKTRDAAVQISDNIETLTNWISALGQEASGIATQAAEVLENASGTDTALSRMETSISSANEQAQRIAQQAERMETAMADFAPALSSIDASVNSTSTGIEQTHERILNLIDTSETIVQSTALIGGNSVDTPFIQRVQSLARALSQRLEEAVDSGATSMSQLFDRTYRPIPGTNPEQVMAECTKIMDEVLPPLQEPVLEMDSKVVFCAAVDINGYLPTHNRKFSQPPGDDPVWNMANCRNRRIFDDRVGLKAGRNTEPFLLQVYRRDMGGGEFKMMKDLSAPIFVKGKHWGGLRLAYTF